MSEVACKIRGLEKAFGPNKVLRSIDLDLLPGKVTVLMGANGAGKSTLVKILCGVHQSDSGSIDLFGRPFRPRKPAEAFQAGVVTVHQAINDGVVPDLNVASNLMLDRLTNKKAGFFIAERNIRSEAKKIADTMGLSLDVNLPVSELGVADRQLIAIARAMARNPKVLILDEPTSSLSAKEADRLFKVLDRLRKTDVAILYISHRMSDIREIADKIICMRDGSISGTFSTKPLDYEGAVTAMLGHKMTDVDIKIAKKGEEILKLDNLALSDQSIGINLSVYKSEVVAITGLLGSGKTELASILFGVKRQASGTIYLNNKPFSPNNPREAIKKGVYMSPKDRASNAVIGDFDIERNLTLPFLGSYAWLSMLRFKFLRKLARNKIEEMGVICQSENDEIETLSGGNQQKVVVGRWLMEPCSLLVLDEPFQGVDIKARRDIGTYIRKTSNSRATIVLVAELDEALEIADRILVMNEKSLVGEHVNDNVNINKLLGDIAGKNLMPEQISR